MANLTARSLTARDHALLRAMADGRCEMGGGSWPVLYVDGRAFCDPAAAHNLVAAGLVVAPEPGTRRGPARLTDAGRAELAG